MTDVIILSGDAVFAGLLKTEAERMGMTVLLNERQPCRLLLVDCDDRASIEAVKNTAHIRAVGITRNTPNGPSPDFVEVLHRPLLMPAFRETVKRLVSDKSHENARDGVNVNMITGLTPNERIVFEALTKAYPSGVSRERLAELTNCKNGNSVEVNICSIRKKLGDNNGISVKNIRGEGYSIKKYK